jgi:hypothetical protein
MPRIIKCSDGAKMEKMQSKDAGNYNETSSMFNFWSAAQLRHLDLSFLPTDRKVG